jgi:hypothetical protein
MPAECAVISSISETAAQPAEVSGWDAEGQFFVEIADLHVNDSGDTTTRLCRRVSSGSLVFVRLLYGHGQDAYEKGHPAAHDAHPTETTDFTRRCRIRLIPCQPRAARRRGDQTVAPRI